MTSHDRNPGEYTEIIFSYILIVSCRGSQSPNMESPVPGAEETSCSSDFVLESPTTVREFENKKGQQWAKQIVIDYWTRTDEGWLLAPLLKILSVIAKENPTPGGLSRSYHLEVFYKTGDNMTQLHWFVKIPKSLQTVAMDERELVMYNTIFPKLNTFIKTKLKPGLKKFSS